MKALLLLLFEAPKEDIESVKSGLLKEEEEEAKKLKPKPKSRSENKSSEPAYITHGGRIFVPDDKDSKKAKDGKGVEELQFMSKASSKVQKFEKPKENNVIEVGIPETITVADLAQKDVSEGS